MSELSTGNHLFYGDNLDVLRAMPDGVVDLVYLDPPFNSNARDDVRGKGVIGCFCAGGCPRDKLGCGVGLWFRAWW